jgi:hypothetical protein
MRSKLLSSSAGAFSTKRVARSTIMSAGGSPFFPCVPGRHVLLTLGSGSVGSEAGDQPPVCINPIHCVLAPITFGLEPPAFAWAAIRSRPVPRRPVQRHQYS